MARRKKKTESDVNPAAPSLDYQASLDDWNLVKTLLGGTRSMREAGEEYLPKHSEEETDAYEARIQETVLAPFFEEAVEGVVSRVFADPVILKDDDESTVKQFKEHANDITGLGENLDGFARRSFQSGVAYGMAWLFVDNPKIAPVIEEEIDGEKVVRDRTLADDIREKVRPWWRLYPALNVPLYEVGPVGAGYGLTRIHLSEIAVKTDPTTFEQSETERVRVLTPTEWKLFERERSDSALGEADKWVEVDGGPNPLGVVPCVPLPLGRYERPYLCKPPFLDLAYLNVRHWQSYSDQAGILTKQRFAMLAFSGSQLPVRVSADGKPTNDGTLNVGPSTVLTGDENSEWYYVAAPADSAEPGWKDLDRLESRMSALALQPFMAERTGTPTATAKGIDSSQANSRVQAWAMMLKDALETAWSFHAKWMDMNDEEPVVHVNTDYGLSLTASEMADLLKMRAMRELSLKTMWLEAKRRGILSPTFDAEQELQNLLEEGPPPGMEASQGFPEQGEGGFDPGMMTDGTGGFAEPLLSEPGQAAQSNNRLQSDGIGLNIIRGTG